MKVLVLIALFNITPICAYCSTGADDELCETSETPSRLRTNRLLWHRILKRSTSEEKVKTQKSTSSRLTYNDDESRATVDIKAIRPSSVDYEIRRNPRIYEKLYYHVPTVSSASRKGFYPVQEIKTDQESLDELADVLGEQTRPKTKVRRRVHKAKRRKTGNDYSDSTETSSEEKTRVHARKKNKNKKNNKIDRKRKKTRNEKAEEGDSIEENRVSPSVITMEATDNIDESEQDDSENKSELEDITTKNRKKDSEEDDEEDSSNENDVEEEKEPPKRKTSTTNVKYHFAPKTTVPLPECFHNPSGYVCCNLQLNNLIEDVFQEIKEDASFSSCNIDKMANMVQKKSEEMFSHPFESIVSLGDFAQNINFAGDLVCKLEIDGKFIISYGTPHNADNAVDMSSNEETGESRGLAHIPLPIHSFRM